MSRRSDLGADRPPTATRVRPDASRFSSSREGGSPEAHEQQKGFGMRQQCPVFDGEWGADRLGELGLKAEILEFALRGADAEARTYTQLDPPNMQGMARYSRTVR